MQLEEEKNIKNCLHTKSFSNCIYFMNVLIRKICRINCDCILKKKLRYIVPTLVIVDVQDQNSIVQSFTFNMQVQYIQLKSQ